jgi:hypothetical protein
LGYCTWRPYSGGAVAAWIGTGTDIGKSITWTYLKGSKGATSKQAACDAVKAEFCRRYGPVNCNGRRLCYGQKCVNKVSQTRGGAVVQPECGDSILQVLGSRTKCFCADLKSGKCKPGGIMTNAIPDCGANLIEQAISKTGCLCADIKSGKCTPKGVSKLDIPKAEDPYCKSMNCDSLPIWANLGCRFEKARRGCGGSWGTPPLEGNPFGNMPTWVLYGAGLILLLIFLKR